MAGSSPGTPRAGCAHAPAAALSASSCQPAVLDALHLRLAACREDIRICRNNEGNKCRLGEGGFGIVYKALMNGVRAGLASSASLLLCCQPATKILAPALCVELSLA